MVEEVELNAILYVCDRSHTGNFFLTQFPAIEINADGIVQETNALCLCGGIARRVTEKDAVLLLSPAEQAQVYSINLETSTEELPVLEKSTAL